MSNPLNPPDLLECVDNDNLNLNITEENVANNGQTGNLIDLLDTSNEMRVTYPDYSGSTDSSVSASTQSNQQNNINNNHMPLVNIDFSANITDYQSNLNNMNKLNESILLNNQNSFNVYKSNVHNKQDNSHIYYNLPIQHSQHYNNDVSANSINFKTTNPFFNDQKLPTDVNHNVNNNINSKPKHSINNSITTNNTTTNNSKLNVDDLLNKYMNDFMNDFKNIKLNSN